MLNVRPGLSKINQFGSVLTQCRMYSTWQWNHHKQDTHTIQSQPHISVSCGSVHGDMRREKTLKNLNNHMVWYCTQCTQCCRVVLDSAVQQDLSISLDYVLSNGAKMLLQCPVAAALFPTDLCLRKQEPRGGPRGMVMTPQQITLQIQRLSLSATHHSHIQHSTRGHCETWGCVCQQCVPW